MCIAEEKARYSTLEDRDEYTAENVFWVPGDAGWINLQDQAKDTCIGILIDEAMLRIETENPPPQGSAAKNFSRQELVQQIQKEGDGNQVSPIA